MSLDRPPGAAGEVDARPQTVTLLYADLAGSTQLVRTLGDEFPDLLRGFHAVVRDAVTAHGGRVERTEGDRLLCAFGDAVASAVIASDTCEAVLRRQAIEDRIASALR